MSGTVTLIDSELSDSHEIEKNGLPKLEPQAEAVHIALSHGTASHTEQPRATVLQMISGHGSYEKTQTAARDLAGFSGCLGLVRSRKRDPMVAFRAPRKGGKFVVALHVEAQQTISPRSLCRPPFQTQKPCGRDAVIPQRNRT